MPAAFAMLFPFAPTVRFPNPSIRESNPRQKSGKCEWLAEHAVFFSHGMERGAECHTLETKPMPSQEAMSLLAEIQAGIQRHEEFIDKYNVVRNNMKHWITVERLALELRQSV